MKKLVDVGALEASAKMPAAVASSQWNSTIVARRTAHVHASRGVSSTSWNHWKQRLSRVQSVKYAHLQSSVSTEPHFGMRYC